MTIEIDDILARLAKVRPVFHSEADFQHALAWEIRERHPDAKLRLEVPFGESERLDIHARLSGAAYAIELKYLTRGATIEVGGDKFSLKTTEARPQRRYDFVRDIARLEHHANKKGEHGYAILLTNEPAYWERKHIGNVSDAGFRLHEGNALTGACSWADHTAKVAKDRPNLVLTGSYVCRWQNYVLVDGHQFRVLIIAVAPTDRSTGSRPGPATPSPQQRVQGSLLGGAVGDALGAPVEFLTLAKIRARFGPEGIKDFAPAFGQAGMITDDTQMALFTAEGLIRAAVRSTERGICHPPSVVHHAYLRWLKTQGEEQTRAAHEVGLDGWIIGLKPLWACRAPGATCISALIATTGWGSPARNDSKGCGAVMRTAPVGLGLAPVEDRIFDLAAEMAALTHGHRTAALSAGFLSLLISQLVEGASLTEAIAISKRRLLANPDNRETLRAIEMAERLAAAGPADAASVERLGGGWVAEEAVAIALYAALKAETFEEAVILAVNHSGDSDSTGAIAGNIAGALYGIEAIPVRWLKQLELLDEITAVADDLFALRTGGLYGDGRDPEEVCRRYPGW